MPKIPEDLDAMRAYDKKQKTARKLAEKERKESEARFARNEAETVQEIAQKLGIHKGELTFVHFSKRGRNET